MPRSLADVADAVWYGDSAADRAARAALAPLGWLFAGAARGRSWLYDAGVARAHALALPALSVGNLTVGGTGKTPVAAWFCATLRTRGLRPAIVLRGVGGDEPRVHAMVNPDVPVVCDADRIRGTERAAALGADTVVLDDAFQHRRARRDVDVVLLGAERFGGSARALPAGPYRELPRALERASLVIVTRKSAPASAADAALDVLARRHPTVARAVVHLLPDGLRRWPTADGGEADAQRALGLRPGGRLELRPERLRGESVLAIAAVGEPGAFAAQLAAQGARVTLARYPDHHAYRADDVRDLVRRAGAVDRVVTTLKDAVKLGPLWPRRAPALWYVSQRVSVERGETAIGDAVDVLVAAAERSAHAHRPT